MDKLLSDCKSTVEAQNYEAETQNSISNVQELSAFLNARPIIMTRYPFNFLAQNNMLLVRASEYGHFNVVMELLKNEKCLVNAHGNGALKMAAKYGHFEILRLLLNDNRINLDMESNSPLIAALDSKRYDIVSMLLDDHRINPCVEEHEIVIQATEEGMPEIVDKLIAHPRSCSAIASDVRLWRGIIEKKQEDELLEMHSEAGGVKCAAIGAKMLEACTELGYFRMCAEILLEEFGEVSGTEVICRQWTEDDVVYFYERGLNDLPCWLLCIALSDCVTYDMVTAVRVLLRCTEKWEKSFVEDDDIDIESLLCAFGEITEPEVIEFLTKVPSLLRKFGTQALDWASHEYMMVSVVNFIIDESISKQLAIDFQIRDGHVIRWAARENIGIFFYKLLALGVDVSVNDNEALRISISSRNKEFVIALLQHQNINIKDNFKQIQDQFSEDLQVASAVGEYFVKEFYQKNKPRDDDLMMLRLLLEDDGFSVYSMTRSYDACVERIEEIWCLPGKGPGFFQALSEYNDQACKRIRIC